MINKLKIFIYKLTKFNILIFKVKLSLTLQYLLSDNKFIKTISFILKVI